MSARITAMVSKPDLLADLLALPVTERSRYARKLLDSLDPTHDEDAAQAWLDELEVRNRELDAGTASLEDWDQVRARIADHLQTL